MKLIKQQISILLFVLGASSILVDIGDFSFVSQFIIENKAEELPNEIEESPSEKQVSLSNSPDEDDGLIIVASPNLRPLFFYFFSLTSDNLKELPAKSHLFILSEINKLIIIF